MADIPGWTEFGVRLFLYSIGLVCLAIGLLGAFVIGYYWFVVRRRSETTRYISKELDTRLFVFHTLTLEVSDNWIIVLKVQLSQLEKQSIEFARLNDRRYQIRAVDIQDEHVDIAFVESDMHLTIKHEHVEQQR